MTTQIADGQLIRQDTIPKGIGEIRSKILASALADLGVREDPRRANRGALDPLGRGVDRFQPHWVPDPAPQYAWCAAAVCTWWHDGMGSHPFGHREGSVDKLQDLAIFHERYRKTHPIPGDAFILLHGRDTQGIDRGHAGLVLRVIELAEGRGRIRTIEGNLRNAVRLVDRVYDLKLQQPETILGFVSPLPFSEDPADFERGFEGFAERPDGATR